MCHSEKKVDGFRWLLGSLLSFGHLAQQERPESAQDLLPLRAEALNTSLLLEESVIMKMKSLLDLLVEQLTDL